MEYDKWNQLKLIFQNQLFVEFQWNWQWRENYKTDLDVCMMILILVIFLKSQLLKIVKDNLYIYVLRKLYLIPLVIYILTSIWKSSLFQLGNFEGDFLLICEDTERWVRILEVRQCYETQAKVVWDWDCLGRTVWG